MFVVESNSADAEKPFGIEEITDDEKIYRRIPVSRRWVDATTRCIDPQAFAPDRKRDITGLSVVRAAHATPEQAAKGASRQGYPRSGRRGLPAPASLRKNYHIFSSNNVGHPENKKL